MGKMKEIKAEVTRVTIFSAQVCVPKTWTDEQALEFLEREAPCGTTRGWNMRKQGHRLLSGCDERVDCSETEEKCHIMFDA